MVPVSCRTNLDDVGNEEWPRELPFRPNVGDYIQSGTSHKNGVQIELKVVRVTFRKVRAFGKSGGWYAEVEMHLPPHFDNIAHWEAYYDWIRGKTDDERYFYLADIARKAARGERA